MTLELVLICCSPCIAGEGDPKASMKITFSKQRIIVDYPIFDPPNAPEHGRFICKYPELPDYEPCSQHDDRGCWLKPKNPKSKKPTYNIYTDYENVWPKGVTRKYTLDVTNETLYPDGCRNDEGKVFNGQYPGPWIEACWGDDIEVTVRNHLPCNGTSIHWHGLRQYNSNEYDGVNAVTQCPIAPGETYTYKFHARQYGTSWYHSHYSLQYPDGMAGPLTIHGPSSGGYDTAKDPILMTDWNQRSAFEDWAWSLGRARPKMSSILLNGHGVAPPDIDTCEDRRPTKLHTLSFQKGVRYLLYLINTSVDTTFVFSIDGHNLTVIESDFVPIEPYTNTSVLVGIGQRYHVVVEANPWAPTEDENYWIRTVPATQCGDFRYPYTIENATTGIVRYGRSTADPSSKPNDFAIKCSDETYSSLKPILKWQIPESPIDDTMDVNIVTPASGPYYPSNLARWQMYKSPLWLNFSDPTLLSLEGTSTNWTAELSVTTKPYVKRDQWVELLITGPGGTSFAAHPIHLHGHDFALLAQDDEPYRPETAVLKRDNPPRRDVALLPINGYLIIAFKVDNPGVWLMHCHIAWHASSGLAMQILENTDRIKFHDKPELKRTCRKWNKWFNGKQRVRDGCLAWKEFQDDSGI
ncbi:hypothetical protein CC78DRAFT_561712 [Lojkania enalia]|uniref:Laccase n=1 Tax=Lojkania enalia TaxID=147567 RepID=A0A9P4K4V0_9PLEO|nr:hypothetical protein CC78DRAFT_561712 [Didymosphaeria enalia]